jgi:hypothetical protein
MNRFLRFLCVSVLFPAISPAQLTGVWKCTIDTTVMGYKLIGEDYYIFTIDNRIYNFSVTDTEAPKLYCFTLVSAGQGKLITRFERRLTDAYSMEKITNMIYSDYYANASYDTIDMQMLSPEKIKLTTVPATNTFSRVYSRISHTNYVNIDTGIFSACYSRINGITKHIENKQLKQAKESANELFNLLYSQDEIMQLVLWGNAELFLNIKKGNAKKVKELFDQSIAKANSTLALRCLYGLIYLKISDDEILALYEKMNI